MVRKILRVETYNLWEKYVKTSYVKPQTLGNINFKTDPRNKTENGSPLQTIRSVELGLEAAVEPGFLLSSLETTMAKVG